MDRLQQHPHEALTGRRGGGRSSMSRRQGGRFHHGSSDSDDGGSGSGPSSSGPGAAMTAAVVDHAECTAQSCRSCVAVSLADCIALGCCPCAVVSLLGLALVKAPLAVGRRCLRRLLRRRGKLRQKKRVCDDDMDLALAAGKRPGAKCAGHAAPLGGEEITSTVEDDMAAAAASEAERVWLEMYQVGQWGFGRLSFSINPPPKPGYVATASDGYGDGCEESDV